MHNVVAPHNTTPYCYNVGHDWYLFSPVGCGAPFHPENGSVQSLDISQGTQQGSEIVFSCNTSYVPAGNMMSVCGSDGMWNPDPATFVCICKFICHYSLRWILWYHV